MDESFYVETEDLHVATVMLYSCVHTLFSSFSGKILTFSVYGHFS